MEIQVTRLHLLCAMVPVWGLSGSFKMDYFSTNEINSFCYERILHHISNYLRICASVSEWQYLSANAGIGLGF